jgi:hypothetical protein
VLKVCGAAEAQDQVQGQGNQVFQDACGSCLVPAHSAAGDFVPGAAKDADEGAEAASWCKHGQLYGTSPGAVGAVAVVAGGVVVGVAPPLGFCEVPRRSWADLLDVGSVGSADEVALSLCGLDEAAMGVLAGDVGAVVGARSKRNRAARRRHQQQQQHDQQQLRVRNEWVCLFIKQQMAQAGPDVSQERTDAIIRWANGRAYECMACDCASCLPQVRA